MSRDDAIAVFIALDSNGDGQMSQQVRTLLLLCTDNCIDTTFLLLSL